MKRVGARRGERPRPSRTPDGMTGHSTHDFGARPLQGGHIMMAEDMTLVTEPTQ